MRLRDILGAGLWLCSLAGNLPGALLLQDFENGTVLPGTMGPSYSNLGPCGVGSPSELAPEGSYAVTSNAQDCHRLWFSTGAHEGSNFLAVNGMTAIGLVYQQAFTGLVPGETYGLSAWFAGLYTINPATITWNILFGGTAPTNSFTTNTTGIWQQNGISFLATESSFVFSISVHTTQASGNDFGIDTIRLDGQMAQTIAETSIPEPASSWLLGTGIAAIWGLLPARSPKPVSRDLATGMKPTQMRRRIFLLMNWPYGQSRRSSLREIALQLCEKNSRRSGNGSEQPRSSCAASDLRCCFPSPLP